jgi:hydroxypyruvate reductase
MPDIDRPLLLHRMFEAAVQAAHPDFCLVLHLPLPPEGGRMMILAAGKAAGSMMRVAEKHYRETHGLGPDRLVGLGVARIGYGAETPTLKVLEAGHPVPDAAGIAATRQVMELASTATAKDQVLVLLSGGGSANWIAPAGALTLAEKQGITRALLKSGATISEINTVRKHLSAIKGGRLVRLASPAPVLTLAISDVPHDDPSIIASGPTVPDPSTLGDARAIVEKYRIELPGSARALLNDPANETPKPDDPVFSKSEFRLVARPAQSVEAAAEIARHAGYKVQNLGADLEGEARHVAALHANLARDAAKSGQRLVLLSGGELTVTVKGQGRGGPNQEYALALALELGGHPGIIALAGDTDGTDGGGGNADDPAGALIDETTLERAAALGLNPAAFLANNDATGFFEHLGDLLTPGPTGTNVNDLRAIIIG